MEKMNPTYILSTPFSLAMIGKNAPRITDEEQTKREEIERKIKNGFAIEI